MKKRVILGTMLIGLSCISLWSIKGFCLNETLLDKAKQYEKNIEDYCTTEEMFLEESDSGSHLADPKGKSENITAFSYYEKDGVLKQIYRNADYVCVVDWSDS